MIAALKSCTGGLHEANSVRSRSLCTDQHVSAGAGSVDGDELAPVAREVIAQPADVVERMKRLLEK